MTERLPKKHDARAQIESLPLEGKVPSAHTGRMRWKSCVLTEVPAFSQLLLATSSVSLRLPASPQGEAFDQQNPLVQCENNKQTSGRCPFGQRPGFLLYWELVSAGADFSFFFFTARMVRVPAARRARAPPPARSARLGRRSNSTAQKMRLSSVRSKTR